MNESTSLRTRLKPGVSRRTLLFVAGFVWTIAGGILLFRGLSHLVIFHVPLLLRILIGLSGGIIFFFLLFNKISKKHSHRIIKLPVEKPCVFSFFNFRSYFMMALMISGGIFIRKNEWVDAVSLYTFFIIMSIPLLMSAGRFYYYGFRFPIFDQKIKSDIIS